MVIDAHAKQFENLLQMCGLRPVVHGPTHVRGHTLDVVITRESSPLVYDISVSDTGICDNNGNHFSDHYAVTFNVNLAKPPPIIQTVSYRKLEAINVANFKKDLRSCPLLNSSDGSLDSLVYAYTEGLRRLTLMHHCRLRGSS